MGDQKNRYALMHCSS